MRSRLAVAFLMSACLAGGLASTIPDPMRVRVALFAFLTIALAGPIAYFANRHRPQPASSGEELWAFDGACVVPIILMGLLASWLRSAALDWVNLCLFGLFLAEKVVVFFVSVAAFFSTEEGDKPRSVRIGLLMCLASISAAFVLLASLDPLALP